MTAIRATAVTAAAGRGATGAASALAGNVRGVDAEAGVSPLLPPVRMGMHGPERGLTADHQDLGYAKHCPCGSDGIIKLALSS